VRQGADDRALYYRQLRHTIRALFLPELTSAQARDAAGLVDRILAEFIVEEESDEGLSSEFGARFRALLEPVGKGELAPVTPEQFDQLRDRAARVVADDAANVDPALRELCRALVEVERSFVERLDELRSSVLAETPEGERAGSVNECSISAEQLTAYLRGRLAGSPGVTVEELSVVPGGRSKETILVTLAGTDELPTHVILRKDRPVSLLQTKAADEFAAIKAVHEYGGVPVPRPYFAGQEDQGLGAGTFLVMECVPGHKAGEFFPDLAAPTEHQHEIGLQLAAALARLHSMPMDRLTDTGLDTQGAVSEESIVRAVEGMSARIDELTGPPCPTVPLARQWALEHVGDVVPAGALALLQGDFGLHNMLVEAGRITALVDWEAATIGPPARELAAAWNAVHALMDWQEFTAAYMEAGGPPEATGVRAINFYRVLSALGGFLTSRTGGHLFRTGAKRDLLTAHSGLDSRLRCERNLARALTDAMQSSD
jgi:aminoglycoside phosphotransferase (APT) family kinase protein